MSIVTEMRPVISNKRTQNKFAPYWENDQCSHPVLVQFIRAEGDWVEIRFQDGSEKMVNCHTLGIFRTDFDDKFLD